MKKSILFTALIAAFIAVIMSCTPEPGPQPTTPPTTQNNPNPDFTTDEGITLILIGKWQLDSIVEYNNDTWWYRHPYPVMNITFTDVPYNTTPGSTLKQCSYGQPGSIPTAGSWTMSASQFQTTGRHYISGGMFAEYIYSITSTTMITSINTANVKQGTYHFYTKI